MTGIVNRTRYTHVLLSVGGTNARGCRQLPGKGIELVEATECDRYTGIEHLIRAEARRLDITLTPNVEIALSVAGPVIGDYVEITNRDENWSFSLTELARILGVHRVVAENDFGATALGILAVPTQELFDVRDLPSAQHAPRLVMGPGTGLGAAVLEWENGAPKAKPGQGGHIQLAAPAGHGAARHVVEILSRGMTDGGRVFDPRLVQDTNPGARYVSAEKGALSGQGLKNLFGATRLHIASATTGSYDAALTPDAIEESLRLTPADITERAIARTDQVCMETLDLFAAFLGHTAGTLVLSRAGANAGGVYFAGGIVPKIVDGLLGLDDGQQALNAFWDTVIGSIGGDRADMTEYLSEVPVFMVPDDDDRELIGLAEMLSLAA